MSDPSQEPSVQPQVSPDGRWAWDGHNWVPPAHPEGSRRPVEGQDTAPPYPVRTPASRTQYGVPAGVRLAPGQAKLPTSNVTRNVVLLGAVAAILFVGGCLAVVGGAVSQFRDEGSVTYDMGGFDSTGMTHVVDEGQRFGMLFLRYRAGWKVTDDGRGHATVVGLEVLNQRSESAKPAVLFHVLDGRREIASVRCSAPSVPSSGVAKLRCAGKDALPTSWSRIRVESLR